ncbi:hypothetical protein EV648_107471 [Kribbella sp. VKM Ac-2568]|nr:hypothetical protein EV648_107471 [Kribbella sp. VKM Ac-2568]
MRLLTATDSACEPPGINDLVVTLPAALAGDVLTPVVTARGTGAVVGTACPAHPVVSPRSAQPFDNVHHSSEPRADALSDPDC